MIEVKGLRSRKSSIMYIIGFLNKRMKEEL